jgi:hypothetical protein
MSDDRPQWFAPKRYGFGSGPPISWQGWLVTLTYSAIVIGVAVAVRHEPLKLVAIVIPLTAVFLTICARTTRGGWRWRWGDED